MAGDISVTVATIFIIEAIFIAVMIGVAVAVYFRLISRIAELEQQNTKLQIEVEGLRQSNSMLLDLLRGTQAKQ